MKKRLIGKARISFTVAFVAFSIGLPAQAQLASKASPHRMRAGGGHVIPAEVSLPGSVAVLASEWISVGKSASVTGDVIVNDVTPGPFPSGFALSVDGATVAGDVKAASVNVAKFSTVNSVCTDDLTSGGATINGATGPYSTSGAPPCEDTPPIYSPLPPFNSGSPGASDVIVSSNGSATMGAGRVRDIVVGKNGVLFVTGGLVEAASVFMDSGAKLLFQSASELRVAGRFQATKSDEIGPSPGSGVNASQIVVHVEGLDAGALPFESAAVVGEQSTAAANFYAANGTFDLGKSATLTGAVVALRAILETGAILSANSAFTNKAPTAQPQSVLTNGAASIEIILDGNDPEGEDLTFSIITPPDATIGSITSGPTLIVPPAPPGRCSVSGDSCTVNGDCPMGEICDPSGNAAPVTMASVTYTPVDPGANALNSFSFQVADPPGATGVAVVNINDIIDTSPPPPPAAAVDAPDIPAETTTDTPVTIALNAGACAGSTLQFQIESLPANGTLSEAGIDIETVPHALAESSVVFMPAFEFSGNTSFQYRATDTAASCTTVSDFGTVSVSISPPAELAPDQSVTTSRNKPVQIILLANPGGAGSPSVALKAGRVAAGLPTVNTPGAAIAGNVSDSNGDGFGDGKDNLPGSTPALISAGVDVNLGGGTLTWTLNGITFADGGTASGTFDYNAGTETVSNWNITVSGGGIDFPPVTYDPTNSTASVSCPASWGCPATQEKTIQFEIDIPSQSNDRHLRITPIAPLTAAGGDIAINLNTGPAGNPSGSVECFNCSPFRLIDGGSVSAPSSPQGIYRIQVEWNLASLPGDPGVIDSCIVTLTTNKGSVDSLDTPFFAGADDQNGTLDLSDFEAPVGGTALAVMPASIGVVGSDVPFSFEVTTPVKEAISAGFSHFSVSGRVDEGLAGAGFERGLQIRSTASGNLLAGTEPQLTCDGTPPVGSQVKWTILSLPSAGTLLDPTGSPVFVGQQFTTQPTLTFISPVAGTFTFEYSAINGIFDTAVVTIVVQAGDDCVFNGRDPGCLSNP